MEDIKRNYPSIRRMDNANGKYDWIPAAGDWVIVEEKIDGSNMSFMNDGGKLRVFSKNRELTAVLQEWKGLTAFVQEHGDKLIECIPKGEILVGEWLGIAKLLYNKKANIGEVQRFWPFDLIKSMHRGTNDVYREFGNTTELNTVLDALEFKVLTSIVVTFTNIRDFGKRFVDGQLSEVDGVSMKEGIVIKSSHRRGRIKLVAEAFAEKSKVGKLKTVKTPPIVVLFESCLTPARLDKFKAGLLEEGLEINGIKDYFKQADRLFDDILAEEMQAIIKAMKKEVKKTISKAIGQNFGADFKRD